MLERRLAELEGMIEKLTKEAQELRTQLKSPVIGDFTGVPLKNIKAVEAARILDEMFNGPRPAAAGGKWGAREERVRVVADSHNNKLMIRAKPSDMTQITKIIESIDNSSAFSIDRDLAGGNIMMITMPNASGATVAEVLGDLLKRTRPDQKVHINDIRVNDAPKVIMPLPKPAPQLSPKVPPGNAAQEKEKGILPPDEKKPTIILTPIGNRLIVFCDDPKMLPFVESAIRFMLESPGIHDFELMPLKHIDAVQAKGILDELFNAVPGLSKKSDIGGSSPPREERVRIVADSNGNRLIVRGSPLDVFMLRRFVMMIDVDDFDARVVSKTHHIRLKDSRASEVAKIVKEVYSEYMNDVSKRSGEIMTPLGTVWGKSASLTVIAAVDQTNTLVIRCPELVMDDIRKQIIMPMEEASADLKKVHSFPLKDAKAAAVAKVLQDLFPEKDGFTLRITSDPGSNTLFIRGNPEEMKKVEAIIRKMDVQPRS